MKLVSIAEVHPVFAGTAKTKITILAQLAFFCFSELYC